MSLYEILSDIDQKYYLSLAIGIPSLVLGVYASMKIVNGCRKFRQLRELNSGLEDVQDTSEGVTFFEKGRKSE